MEPTNDLLNAAFVKAQGAFPVIEKGKSTSYKNVKFAWADLGAIRAAINPVLAAHGLAVSQDVKTENGCVSIQTTVMHTSGQEKVSEWFTLQCSTDPKQIGGNVTYGCRYQLIAFLCIPVQGEDDIDQHGDNGHRAEPAKKPARPPAAYLKDAIDASNGLWTMPDVQKAYFQKYGQPWPPCDKEQWAHMYNMVRTGVEPKDVLK